MTPKHIKKNKEKDFKPKQKRKKRRRSHLKVIKGHKKEGNYEEKIVRVIFLLIIYILTKYF